MVILRDGYPKQAYFGGAMSHAAGDVGTLCSPNESYVTSNRYDENAVCHVRHCL